MKLTIIITAVLLIAGCATPESYYYKEPADMSHVRIHDLRHTFASWLASNPEIPMTVVRDLLGHSSLATTNKYSHLREDALKNAIDKLPNLG